MFQQAFNVYDLDGTYWTLYVEILFYLFMLGIYCIKKLHKIVLIGSICLLLLPFYSILYAHPSISHKVPLVNHFPLFFAGILFYHIYNGVQNYLYYMLILFCFIMQCTLYDDVRSSNVISFYQYIAMLVLYFTVFLLFVNGRLNFIANKVTLFLGKVSYALYAVHEFLSLMILMPFFEPKFGFWPAALLSFLISLGVAYLITQHVEARAVKFIKAKSRKRQQIQGVPLINIVLQKPTSTSDFQNKKHS
ncbi:MAG: acyltransferase [Flavobacterium sp.]|nr:MAG: acyltransferase [Flavobacterium sp.]